MWFCDMVGAVSYEDRFFAGAHPLCRRDGCGTQHWDWFTARGSRRHSFSNHGCPALLAFMIFWRCPLQALPSLFKPEMVRRSSCPTQTNIVCRLGGAALRYGALFAKRYPSRLLTSDHLLPYTAYPANRRLAM
jgi:hypothetical protein